MSTSNRSVNIRYTPSTYTSDPSSLVSTQCKLLAHLKTIFPGTIPQVVSLASVDSVRLVGVSKISRATFASLKKFGVFDYELREETLTLYISRNQRSVCVAFLVTVVYGIIGSVCLLSGVALWK